MATASRFNRAYTSGLAAGSQPGGGFGSSFQSSFQSSMAAPAVAQGYGGQAPQTKPQATSFNSSIDWGPTGQPAPWQAPPPAAQPAPDMVNMFGPAPRPSAAQGYGGQAPPPGLGQPAPLPFGGFRARGGPVMPGQAYMVGERGPEMIVPQQPGIVVPNGAMPPESRIAQSPMNRDYGGGLADRGPVPVGRGIDDPQRQSERLNRIARQRFGQTGDPSLMYSMNWRSQMGRGGPLPPMGPMPTAAAPMQPPAPPAGRFVPGRSTGSQVWVPDAAMAPELPMLTAPEQRAGVPALPSMPAAPMPQSMPGTFSAPLAPWQQPMMPPSMGGSGVTGLLPDPNKGAFDPAAPLPSSPLASYTPPPPALSFQALPGNPGYGAPVVNGEVQKQFLPMPQPDRAPPPGLVPQAATIGGVQYGAPAPAKPAAMPKFQQDTNSGKMFYVVPNDKGGYTRKWVDEDGNGTVSAAEQSKATAVQTAAGNRFRPVQ